MPSSVRALFEAVGLEPAGPVRYGCLPDAPHSGVYVVAHVEDPSIAADHARYAADIDLARIERWLSVATEMTLDGSGNPSPEAVRDRLLQFWLPNEPVLYVGGTKRPVRARVRELYRHRLGEPRKHSGGHWLKALADLDAQWVFWAALTDSRDPTADVEQAMIAAFVRGIPSHSRKHLRDPDNPFPWANREWEPAPGHCIVKNHGLGKQTARGE